MDNLIKELQTVEQEQLVVRRNISQAIRGHEEQLKSLEARDKELRKKLVEAMEVSIANGGSNVFQNDVIRINYIAPQIKTIVDVKRLKDEAPELYAEFTKESYVNASLKISIYETDR